MSEIFYNIHNVQVNQSFVFIMLERTDIQTVATTFETKYNKAGPSSVGDKPYRKIFAKEPTPRKRHRQI